MEFTYSRTKIGQREKFFERLLEIVPALSSWGIIIGTAVLSLRKPILAAVILIAFVLLWIMRLLYMNIFLVLSYMRLSIERSTRWMVYIDKIDENSKEPDFTQGNSLSSRISAFFHRSRMEELNKSPNPPPKSKQIYHLVIIPVIKEGREIVEPGLINIAKGDYPGQRILVVIALEESASGKVKSQMYELKEKYKGYFLDFFIILHPNGLDCESRVKGANATYAARQAVSYFDARSIPYSNVIVSCFDADTVASPQYFSCLAYHFIVMPDRTRISYQPIPVYHNNIWDAPGFARIIDIGTSFFQLVEATNPSKLVTFSSHSMSLKALVEVGYWPRDMISDDSAIFWKSFIYYNGKYRTIPIYTTVSMDIALGRSAKETFFNIYRQKRRWAWGIENFPIVIRAFVRAKAIPFYKKIIFSFKLIDSFVSWATWSFLLVLAGWFSVLFTSKEFSSTTVYYIAPRIQTTIFSLASLGLIVCMAISILLLPRKKNGSGLSKIAHALEWSFIPFVILVLSALPALDAQTRLMFGRYMEFRATDKYRKPKNHKEKTE